MDHNLTDNQRLTFRYIHDTWGTIQQGPLWGQYNNTFDNTNTNFVGPTTSFVARLTSNFSPSLLNEFVASYTDDHIFLSTFSNSGINLPRAGLTLLPLFANGPLKTRFPLLLVGNANSNAQQSEWQPDLATPTVGQTARADSTWTPAISPGKTRTPPIPTATR